jgi:hypothetical protein
VRNFVWLRGDIAERLKFLISFQGPFQPLISINEYWDLILMVMLGLGVVFEMPILIFFLALFGIVTPKFLLHNFRYAMLIITVIAAIVTPTPDATTMLVFMAPMVVLYFVGILVAYFVVRNKKRAAENEGADMSGDAAMTKKCGGRWRLLQRYAVAVALTACGGSGATTPAANAGVLPRRPPR